MKVEAIKAATAEATRFLKLAKVLRDACPSNPNDYDTSPSKHSGALRRSSMDLTRALAEMRRPS